MTGFTANSNTSASVRNPSVTVTDILTIPLKFKFGVIVNTLSETMVLTNSLSLSASNINSELSTSSAYKVIVKATSSLVSCAPMTVNSGASFTGVTTTRTSSTAMSLPSESLTINVRISSPCQFISALKVTR